MNAMLLTIQPRSSQRMACPRLSGLHLAHAERSGEQMRVSAMGPRPCPPHAERARQS